MSIHAHEQMQLAMLTKGPAPAPPRRTPTAWRPALAGSGKASALNPLNHKTPLAFPTIHRLPTAPEAAQPSGLGSIRQTAPFIKGPDMDDSDGFGEQPGPLERSHSPPCFSAPYRSPQALRRSMVMTRRGLATGGGNTMLPSLGASSTSLGFSSKIYASSRPEMVPPKEDGVGCLVNGCRRDPFTHFIGRHSNMISGFSPFNTTPYPGTWQPAPVAPDSD